MLTNLSEESKCCFHLSIILRPFDNTGPFLFMHMRWSSGRSSPRDLLYAVSNGGKRNFRGKYWRSSVGFSRAVLEVVLKDLLNKLKKGFQKPVYVCWKFVNRKHYVPSNYKFSAGTLLRFLPASFIRFSIGLRLSVKMNKWTEGNDTVHSNI